jgi:hypothetical protein
MVISKTNCQQQWLQQSGDMGHPSFAKRVSIKTL